MGHQHQKTLRAGERRGWKGGGGGRRHRGQGASEGGGRRKLLAAAGDPQAQMNLGEGPTAPMPMPMRGGQRGGVDGDEKGLTRVRSLFVTGSQ